MSKLREVLIRFSLFPGPYSRAINSVVLLLVHATLLGQELPFTQYTPEKEVNPLPSSAVMQSYQDRQGYIWFVVYSSGLARYNGHHLEQFTSANGLSGVDVRQVSEDRGGRLWVASEAGISVSKRPLQDLGINDTIEFTKSIGSTPLFQQSVIENRMCADTSGRLWVGARGHGIIRYLFVGPDSILVDTVSTKLGPGGQSLDVRALTLRNDGTVLACLSGGKLVSFSADSRLTLIADENVGMPPVDSDALFESRSGTLFGGTVTGLVWKINGKGSDRNVEIASTALRSRITSIVDGLDTTVWVGSEGSGLLRIGGDGGAIHITQKNGLLNDLVTHIMVDHEGSIWISQIGGVSKLRSDFEAYTGFTSVSHGGLPPYLSDPNVNAIVPPSSSNPYHGIWVATSGAGIKFIGTDGESYEVGKDQGLKSGWVNTLALDSEARLWIGSTLGISCLAPSSGVQPPPGQRVNAVRLGPLSTNLVGYGRKNTTIYSTTVAPIQGNRPGEETETIWFTGYQTVYCMCNNRWYVFRTASGLPETYFTSVEIDSEGFVWLGTRDAGLFRSRAPATISWFEKFRLISRGMANEPGDEVVTPAFALYWNEARGAPSNQIESIVAHKGILWVGTPAGASALDPVDMKVLITLTPADGLPGQDVTSMAFSPVTNTLWLGTNGGLAEVDLVQRKVLRSLTKQDGLVDDEVWFYGSVRAGDDGSIYFGTAKGLSLFRPLKVRSNTVPPRVRLESVDREEGSSSNQIRFEYSALSFADEHGVRYRTRLSGYDDHWTDEEDGVSLRYTNLPAFLVPRNYTFEVLARNNSGVWTPEPLAYAFTIQPPWWFRWWWVVANIVLLGGLTYSILHYRTRQLQRRSRELEQTVAERTEEIRIKADQISAQAEELSVKNTELEEKNREIVRTQEQLIVQEKLASLGALTAGIAHEIKNPLNFMNNFSEVSVELAQEIKEDLEAQRDRLDPVLYKRIEASLSDLEQTASKIHEHGKKADGIVRGMLEHSRGKTGEIQPTNINALLEEYANLALHGFQAQDQTFEVEFEKHLDSSIGDLNVFPQDLSRVFLNIVNNSCYALNEKRRSDGKEFVPRITLTTVNNDSSVQIQIRDNGSGIPADVVAKVFNPFFTTKPTGKGTGLGLSLSHDVVVKQHGGTLDVETEEGTYTEFRITIPRRSTKTG